MKLSQNFFKALKASGEPYHQIAWKAGLRPHQLYKITSGIDRPDMSDKRVHALCYYLGMNIAQVFEHDFEEEAKSNE